MAEKKSLRQELTKGFIIENPVLRLVLGTCPTPAVSTSVENALGMGIAATIVLICSNVAISALRKVIPSKVRIPCFVVVIAAFVSLVQMFVKAFAPALDESLGIFLPLIVVNCIILGRAEAFASKNSVIPSAIDGLGMGIGFTCALFIIGSVREILGSGTWMGMTLTADLFDPATIMILPPGGFMVMGTLIALVNRLSRKKEKARSEEAAGGCAVGCPGCEKAT